MEAYLDNSATTRCEKEVAELVTKLMLEDYGNPSSMHLKGVEAEKYINLKSLAKITGIRNDILKQYASGKRIPKSEQEARIIKGIHEIADKLLEII